MQDSVTFGKFRRLHTTLITNILIQLINRSLGNVTKGWEGLPGATAVTKAAQGGGGRKQLKFT